MAQNVDKDKVTYWHQIITLVGAPLIVALLVWFAYAFDAVRTDVQAAKSDINYMQKDISSLQSQFHEVFGFALKSNKTAMRVP